MGTSTFCKGWSMSCDDTTFNTNLSNRDNKLNMQIHQQSEGKEKSHNEMPIKLKGLNKDQSNECFIKKNEQENLPSNNNYKDPNEINLHQPKSNQINIKQSNINDSNNQFNSVNKISQVMNSSVYETHKEGFGVFQLGENSKFVGIFKDGQATGIGTLYADKGFVYKGEFENNKANGYGLYENTLSRIVECEWVDDKQQGYGIEENIDTYLFKGQFYDDTKQGYGTLTWKTGNKYQGEFKNNAMHGFGILQFSDGNKYSGQFKNNQMIGYGEFVWKDGKVYLGEYKDDKKDGFGILLYPNYIYIGFWEKGKQNGISKEYKKDIKSLKYSQWINGKSIKKFDSFGQAQTFLFPGQKTYTYWFNCDISVIEALIDRVLSSAKQQ